MSLTAAYPRNEPLLPPDDGARGRPAAIQVHWRPEPAPVSVPLALYVHIPFCVRKCHYCDFNSGPAAEVLREEYVAAVVAEVQASPWAGQPARTVFFGGGTPSELSTAQLARLASVLRDTFAFGPGDLEWTIECNPGTVTAESLAEMREMGFNRISLGVQSFHDHHLQALGRIHTAGEAEEAIRLARGAGFRRLNLDLIFCLPGQALDEWKSDLERALAFRPEHLSLYNLTIEENTEFGRRYRAGLLSLPDEDASADMYEWAIDRTAAAGMEQYEVSNFALPGEACRHNQIYWRQEPSLGFGLSAASYVAGVRWTHTGSLRRYLRTAGRTAGPELGGSERLGPREACGEAIMLGLRTREGTDLEALRDRYGLDLECEWPSVIDRFVADGLMVREGAVIRLTRPGVMLANAVCAAFL